MNPYYCVAEFIPYFMETMLVDRPEHISTSTFMDVTWGCYCWWKNPANQLRLVVYPIICRVSNIPGGARFLPSTTFLKDISSWWFQPNWKIGSFPQGSGWTFKKYLSCHLLDLHYMACQLVRIYCRRKDAPWLPLHPIWKKCNPMISRTG